MLWIQLSPFADNISWPLLSHTPVLSGNIFPQTLCSLLTASLVNEARTMSCRQRKEEAEESPGERVRDATQQKKPGLSLLMGGLKRTARRAGAHVGCCHGTHQGDGSLLPKMAVLLYWARPVEINLSGAPSCLSLVLLSVPASSI